MKKRPWLTVYILIALSMGILGTIPLGVTAQETQSWDVYQTTWSKFNYMNLTWIEIKHPVNGSLVSTNQKLNFVVVPFDADEYLYTIEVYKNDILMYNCNQEMVYDLDIYTTNPINQIITVTFTLNSKEILRLEYLAILIGPSLDADFTEQWLTYQAQKQNETMSGTELVNRKDQALRDINLVGTTLFWGLIMAGVAIAIVIIFQLIKVINLFSCIVWFSSGLIWLGSMTHLDNTMRTLEFVTADDVFIFYAKAITLTLIILGANLFYFITYKATSTRLNRKEFWAIDKENRTVTKFEAVIGNAKNRIYWRLQDSWSALRRVLFKADYEITYERGNINDTYRYIKTRSNSENIDTKKDRKLLQKVSKRIASKMTFYIRDKETNKKVVPKEPKKEDTKKYNYDAWTMTESNSPLSPNNPILILDGKPEFKRQYQKDAYDDIIKEMKAMAKESSDPKFVKNINKRLKKFLGETKKQKKFVVEVVPSNKDVYAIEDFLIDCKTLDNQANLINRLKDEKHELRRKLIGRAYETGEEIYQGYDKVYEDWEKGALSEGGKRQ